MAKEKKSNFRNRTLPDITFKSKLFFTKVRTKEDNLISHRKKNNKKG